VIFKVFKFYVIKR